MITCRKMTAPDVADAFQMLRVFLSEDEHYLASSKAYGDRGLVAVRAVVDRAGWPPSVGRSAPTTMILDRDGRIAVRHNGYCSREEYQRDILKVLSE